MTKQMTLRQLVNDSLDSLIKRERENIINDILTNVKVKNEGIFLTTEQFKTIVGMLVAGLDCGTYDGKFVADLVAEIQKNQDDDTDIINIKKKFDFDNIAKKALKRNILDSKIKEVSEEEKNTTKSDDVKNDTLDENTAKLVNNFINILSDAFNDSEYRRSRCAKNNDTKLRRPRKHKYMSYEDMDDVQKVLLSLLK